MHTYTLMYVWHTLMYKYPIFLMAPFASFISLRAQQLKTIICKGSWSCHKCHRNSSYSYRPKGYNNKYAHGTELESSVKFMNQRKCPTYIPFIMYTTIKNPCSFHSSPFVTIRIAFMMLCDDMATQLKMDPCLVIWYIRRIHCCLKWEAYFSQ